MATADEKAALLRTPCPWCGAGPGSVCRVKATVGKWRRPALIRSLDAGCHDARWQAALTRPAPIAGGWVPPERRVDTPTEPSAGSVAVLDTQEDAHVYASVPTERPW